MRLIGPVHSCQFMELYNSGITALKYAICAPNVYLPNFLKFCDNISHKLLRPTQSLVKVLEIRELFTLQK